MCPRTKYNRRLVCNSCERHKLASRYLVLSTYDDCSEKYGNDNPSAVRSETSSFVLKSDSGQNGQNTSGMDVVSSPPPVQPPQLMHPVPKDPVMSELPPLVTPLDMSGNYPIHPFGVSESSQNGLFHDVLSAE